jgi:hypothetical protein
MVPQQGHDVPHSGDRFTSAVLKPSDCVTREASCRERRDKYVLVEPLVQPGETDIILSGQFAPVTKKPRLGKDAGQLLWCWPSDPTTKRTNMPPIIPPASLDFRNLRTNTAAASFLTAYPAASRPTTSNINAEHANQTIANQITTRLATAKSTCSPKPEAT